MLPLSPAPPPVPSLAILPFPSTPHCKSTLPCRLTQLRSSNLICYGMPVQYHYICSSSFSLYCLFQDCLSGIHVVHGDLACRNVYLDQNFNVKVADFGIVANGHREVIYVNGLPIRWFAPEVLTDHAFSTASDIWAFGVTVWEIITLGSCPVHASMIIFYCFYCRRLPLPRDT